MAKSIPEGLHSVTAQMNVEGASEAIEFYKKAFGAEVVHVAMDPSGKKIWHGAIRIGDSQIFINDVFPEMGNKASISNFWLYGDDVDARWKRALDAGCKVGMPLADMFWGDRLGSVTDQWGNRWNLAQHVKDMSPAEMQAAQDAFVKSQH